MIERKLFKIQMLTEVWNTDLIVLVFEHVIIADLLFYTDTGKTCFTYHHEKMYVLTKFGSTVR